MYSTVFYGLSQRYGLNPTESHLVAIILSFSKDGNTCYMSEESFAKTLNLSIQTINSSLQELERRGIIERSEKKGRKGTILRRITEKTESHLQYIRDKIGNAKNQKRGRQY
jgi:DNA-binding MarR family transcriptional regulator